MEEYKEIEKSIIKRFRKEIWARFVRGCQEFDLIQENDHIAVCISGGKDSMLLAKCLEELQRHGKVPFQLTYLVMNPGYTEEKLQSLIDNAKRLNIDIQIFESDIFGVVDKFGKESPCYLCARMRRGYLYHKAKELGCNKIALGHHFDDVIETILLNIFYAGEYKSMMPKLHSDHFEGMELIRPLYYVKEQDIIAWAKYNHLTFLDCACKVTSSNMDNKRREIKELIKNLRKVYNNIDINILRSSYQVNLNTVISYHKDGVEHHFLDTYQDK